MRRMKAYFVIAFCILSLCGCTQRELEDREFPSVLTVPAGDLENLQAVRQSESSKFLDYSHTKAVIFSEDVIKDQKKLGKVLAYLGSHPEFARNMLVFIGGREELETAVKKKDKIGFELSDYYKNRPKKDEKDPVTLTDLWNFWNNQEDEIQIPRVKAAGEKLKIEEN